MDIQNLFSVREKIAIITGGASGIGRMIAEGYVQNGATVYLTSRDRDAGQLAARELSEAGPGRAHALCGDLIEYDDCKRMVEEFAARETKLHVLINNAGSNRNAPFLKYPDAAFDKLLKLNLHRAFTMTQLCAPYLAKGASEGDPGRVIHIGSVDGVRVAPWENYAYAASKAGLVHLSKVLASQLAKKLNITSNVIVSGPYKTKMMAAALNKFGDQLIADLPLRLGTPEDVAGTAIFLGSRASANITGATIAVDGGVAVAAKF